MKYGSPSGSLMNKIAPAIGASILIAMMFMALYIYMTPPPQVLLFLDPAITLTENGYVLSATLSYPNESVYITGVDIGGSLINVGMWVQPGKPFEIPLRVMIPPNTIYIYSFGSRSNELKPYIDRDISNILWNIFPIILNGELYIGINATITQKAMVLVNRVPGGDACYIVPEANLAREIERYVPWVKRVDVSSPKPLEKIKECTRIAFLDSYPSPELFNYMKRWGIRGYIGFSESAKVSNMYEVVLSNNTIYARSGGAAEPIFGGVQCIRPIAVATMDLKSDRERALSTILGASYVRSAFYQPIPICTSLVHSTYLYYSNGLPAVVTLSNGISILGAGSPVGLAWASALDLLSVPLDSIRIYYLDPFKGIRFTGPFPPFKRFGIAVLTLDGSMIGSSVSNALTAEAKCTRDICSAALGIGLEGDETYTLSIFQASYNGSLLSPFYRISGRLPISIEVPRIDGLYIVYLEGESQQFQAALGYMRPPKYRYEASQLYEFFTLNIEIDEYDASFTRTRLFIAGREVSPGSIGAPPGPSTVYIVSGVVMGYIDISPIHIYEDPRFILAVAVLSIFTLAAVAIARERQKPVERYITVVLRKKEKPTTATSDKGLSAILSFMGSCASDDDIVSSRGAEEIATVYGSLISAIARGEITAIAAYSEAGAVAAISSKDQYTCFLYILLKESGTLAGIPVGRMIKVLDTQAVYWMGFADAAATNGYPPNASINLYFFQREPGFKGIVDAISRMLSAIYRIEHAYPDFRVSMGPGKLVGLYLVPLPDDYLEAGRIFYSLMPIGEQDPAKYSAISAKTLKEIERFLTPDAIGGAKRIGDRGGAIAVLSNIAVALAHPLQLSTTFASLYVEDGDVFRRAVEDVINYHYILYNVLSEKEKKQKTS